ncbi:hypothetical protein [Paraburkholderia sp. LEh10]|uniref:hypothetical protein n=1 Tax=Paraburkholderia sp. LEh10 TaxID=2821353 RepID=UPI0039185FA0
MELPPFPARLNREIQTRLEELPKPIVDRIWSAQVRLCWGSFQKCHCQGKEFN